MAISYLLWLPQQPLKPRHRPLRLPNKPLRLKPSSLSRTFLGILDPRIPTFCGLWVSGYDLQFAAGLGRRGRTIIPKPVVRAAPAVVRNAREGSLGVRGARLFNLLPEQIRSLNTEHVDYFKNHLDVFLSSVPDQPTVTGLGRAAESNSLLHQLPLFYTQTSWNILLRLTVKLEKPFTIL